MSHSMEMRKSDGKYNSFLEAIIAHWLEQRYAMTPDPITGQRNGTGMVGYEL